MSVVPEPVEHPARRGTALEVFGVFLGLGLRCFGGPVAHLGYFRATFVQQRAWLTDRQFADLLALCQFLPGPASSQMGAAIGLTRAGLPGFIAAWIGFTLPCALLMFAFASGAARLDDSHLGAGLLHGLQLVAVAIVAQAIWGMARSHAPDRARAAIALAATMLMLGLPGSLAQLLVILLGGLAGLALCRARPDPDHDATAHDSMPGPAWSQRGALLCLAAFTLLLALPLLGRPQGGWAVFGAFYHTGALVFGGGHVVLALLRDAVVMPGWISEHRFLAGYGAAQALPGPLFSIAAYLGASLHAPLGGPSGAMLAIAGIFLPGLLLLLATLPFWLRLRQNALAQAALRGTNAAVVGLLAAAFYSPLWTNTITNITDVALAAFFLAMLTLGRTSPLLIVALSAAVGLVR